VGVCGAEQRLSGKVRGVGAVLGASRRVPGASASPQLTD